MKSTFHAALASGIIVAVAGCATAGPPTLQAGPDAEVTIDGLVRVDNAVVPVAFRKPDLDLSGYTRFMLDPVEIAYQKDPGNRTRSTMGGSGGNFALTSSQMDNLREMFQESVVEALTEDDGYELVTEPGPDVLRVSAALIDLVVSVPTEGDVGRGRTFAASYGLVSLILELYDSESGEVLVRGGDRRDPTRTGGRQLAEVNSTWVRSDVTRMFDHWANLLRERLDAFSGGM